MVVSFPLTAVASIRDTVLDNSIVPHDDGISRWRLELKSVHYFVCVQPQNADE